MPDETIPVVNTWFNTKTSELVPFPEDYIPPSGSGFIRDPSQVKIEAVDGEPVEDRPEYASTNGISYAAQARMANNQINTMSGSNITDIYKYKLGGTNGR